MRTIYLAVLVALLSAACTVDSSDVVEEQQQRATLNAIADPTSDLELEDLAGVELGPLGPDSAGFCEAFGAAKLLWIEDALVPLQFVIDAWAPVDDIPAAVADDVAAMRALADRRMDWHLGHSDRDDRPVIDLAMAQRLERIADHAAANCELPLVAGPIATNPDWTTSERQDRCERSESDMVEGIELYRQIRDGDPLHAQQVELAAWVELLDDSDELDAASFWFAPDFHGIGPDGSPAAMGACA